MENTNPPYLFPGTPTPQHRLSEDAALVGERQSELSTNRILLHVFLLACTAITTTFTGASMALKGAPVADDSIISLLFAPITSVLKMTLAGHLEPLFSGLLFTFTLLMILGAHELGHYFACRHYGIRATLPFFIPAPPVISLFGTFGAVIKIKEPITTRRALFDIGLAGPLAGFAFALPASFIGLISASSTLPSGLGGVQFHDPLLFILISKLFGVSKWVEWNPVYWASWGALLVTALNLFPVGQLDGGHVLYAVFGRRLHKWISLLVCLAVATLSILSYVWYHSPMWFLWTIVLIFLLRAGHPPVFEEEPLGKGRILLAVTALLVFLLCFMPFPITITE
ncbi:MAG: site-2 protease family protein [Acidobacteria bacterium]|nr:site-2 protease family protein [Acidobacteriota bacterium]